MPSALITGANRGLGLEFARQYLADGWQVYAACRDPHSASELRRLADASGHKLRILALDVTDPGSGSDYRKHRLRGLGEGVLDVNTILSFRRLDMIGLISSLTIKWEPRANVTLRVRNSGQGLT